VNEGNFKYVMPQSIANNPQAQRLFKKSMSEAKDVYRKLQQLGVKNEETRYVLPNAVQSTIVLSANFRELRHIFCVRCHKRAQDEIRRCCIAMLRIMKKEAPTVFEDFVIDEETVTAHTQIPY
jgi:thymidylate synthase (FAD)